MEYLVGRYPILATLDEQYLPSTYDITSEHISSYNIIVV